MAVEIIKLSVVYRDEDKNIQGGIDFFLPEGSVVVMYQVWEHTASGRLYDPVNPDAIGEMGLLEYFLEAWQDRPRESGDGVTHYEVDDVQGNWR